MILYPYKIVALRRIDEDNENILPYAPFDVRYDSMAVSPVYSNSEGSPFPVPFQCDANGEANIWLNQGRYKIKVGNGDYFDVYIGDDYSAISEALDISGKEEKSNKSQNLLNPSAINYPSTLAVASAIADVQVGYIYKGTWDSQTNTPHLESGIGEQGDRYVVGVGSDGVTELDGNSLWDIGDGVVFSAGAWRKVPVISELTVALALKANIDSPSFTGNPTAPTPDADDDSESIATTEYVQGELTDRVQSVATIADLIALTGIVAGQIFDVTEYSTGLGWGGGRIKSVSGSTTANDVLTFPSATAGIYFERMDVSVIDCDMAGIAGDGTTDDTDKLDAVAAISAGEKIFLNRHCRYHVDLYGGIRLQSNTVFEFGPEGKISLLPHSVSNYGIFWLAEVDNIKIINPVLDGRKDLCTAVGGEFGHGINMRSCGGQVHIVNPIINNCWGDSIYIGQHSPILPPSGHVIIDNPQMTGSRRQGISLVSALSCTINGGFADTIAGTAPEAGIDIEPNANTDTLGPIRINGFTTKNCAGPGIYMFLGVFSGASDKFIDIEINGHTDEGSVNGFKIDGINPTLGTIKGRILVADPIWRNSQHQACALIEVGSSGPGIDISNPTVIDCNRSGQTSPRYGSSFCVLRDSGSIRTYPIGNVCIKHPRIIMNSGSLPAGGLFFAADAVNASNTQKVSIIDPIEISSSIQQSTIVLNPTVFTDRFSTLSRTISTSATLDISSYCPLVRHDRATSSVLTLQAGAPKGYPSQKVENVNTGFLQIAAPSGGNFLGGTVGQYYQCPASAGHFIEFEALGSNVYRVVRQSGGWTLI